MSSLVETNLSTLPRPIALVLSGGASLGAVQVGQLRALAEAGLSPDLFVGTSVGAINALFVARGLTLARVEALEQVWLRLGHPARQGVHGQSLGAVTEAVEPAHRLAPG